MFLKAFKIKSNHQLKVSDKKHLKEEFRKLLPSLTDENLDEILPKKELVTMMKIETASHGIVQVYVVNKRPIAFNYERKLFPTIYLLWQYPNIVLTFTTHTAVLSKLADGAHLMLPGVSYPTFSLFSSEVTNFGENTPACINLTTNKAAVAVGVTAQSSKDMIKSESRGKCVIVYHVYGDKLCTLDNLPCVPIPNQGYPEWMKRCDDMQVQDNQEVQQSIADELTAIISPIINEETNAGNSEEEPCITESAVEEMDKLFCDCFLSAIKYSKDLNIPVLTSTFYKVFMIPACPANKTLDIKKSSHKKFSQFLQSMAEIGIIKVEEQKKGVENLSEINREHPMLIGFNLDIADRPMRPPKEGNENVQPTVVEAHCVTAKVYPVFGEFGFGKGTAISNSDIRKYVTEYVKKRGLQNEENKNYVNLNDTLRAVYTGERCITWQLLMDNVYKSMTPCFKVTVGNTEVIRKGKLETINVSVAKRSGNKKVTLIDNLEVYGINIEELASQCQRGVAASTSINRSQTVKKTDQLQIQGNQVLFVYNLLTEKYKVPKKYIKGLEFAPKKKH